MNQAVRTLVAAIILLCVSGCTDDQSVQVTDVAKSETIVLKQNAGSGAVIGISISGAGSVDGEATISLILNGESYKTERLNGVVNFRWDAEWYAENAEIRYEAINVKSGELIIEYSFSKM